MKSMNKFCDIIEQWIEKKVIGKQIVQNYKNSKKRKTKE